MNHQGNLLRRHIQRSGMTQKVAAEKMGYATHQAFAALYQKETFNEVLREKLRKNLSVTKEILDPTPPDADRFALIENSAWKQLMAAQAKIIELQQVIMDLKEKSYYPISEMLRH